MPSIARDDLRPIQRVMFCAPSGHRARCRPRPAGKLSTCWCTRRICGQDHDWSRMLPEYRRIILDKLKRTAGMEDIESRIVVEHALTPDDINRRYHVLNGGNPTAWPAMDAFSARSSQSNRSPDVRGLYLATWHGAAPIPVLECRWCSCPAGSRPTRWIKISTQA